MESAIGRVLDTIFGALDMFRFWVVLNDYERGVMLRWGKFHREVEPGAHWRVPFKIEELMYVNTRPKTASSWEATLSNKDASPITWGFNYVIAVSEPRKVLLEVEKWHAVASNVIRIEVSKLVRESTDDQIFENGFHERVEESVRKAVGNYGIALVEFGITELAKTRAYRLFNGAR